MSDSPGQNITDFELNTHVATRVALSDAITAVVISSVPPDILLLPTPL